MAKQLQAIRGMNDCLPQQTPMWQHLEGVLRRVVASYGYSEIRMPIVEMTGLFKRAIGEVTDIVEKEMYSFDDRNGDSLTLRPEGTASCVRAGVQAGLLYNQEQRLWYMGPMFRHERPQKGRYRQFHQFGVEVFGLQGPDIDAEAIILSARLWRELGISEQVTLQLNSIGSLEARAEYKDALVAFLSQHKDKLDSDSLRRLETNPLRILDSKNPEIQAVLVAAPKLSQYLDQGSLEHLEGLCQLLDVAGISYEINECLVRGLDYYNRTVFEWVTESLGSQGTVCAGGRYDGLVEQLGGKATPAVGFALGLERLVLMLESLDEITVEPEVNLFIVMAGEGTGEAGLKLAEKLRDVLPHMKIMMNSGGGNFKKQMKKADKSGARLALILGENELAQGQVIIKNLKERTEQLTLSLDAIAEYLQNEA